MAGRRSMAKGSGFERDICRALSLWWTDGKRDDVFWRTSASGARATVRGRQGKQTAGGYGDVCAVDPIGEPLLKVFSIEIKRGYPTASLGDLLDAKNPGRSALVRLWTSAAAAAERAGTPYWMLVHKRDRRRTMIYLPWEFFVAIDLVPWGRGFSLTGSVRSFDPLVGDDFRNSSIEVMRLADFFGGVDPWVIRNRFRCGRGGV